MRKQTKMSQYKSVPCASNARQFFEADDHAGIGAVVGNHVYGDTRTNELEKNRKVNYLKMDNENVFAVTC